MNKKYAFFDLDHTLLPVDSCGLWAYFLFTKCGSEEEALTQKQKQFDEEYFHGQLDMEAFMDFEMAILHRFPRKELEVFREEYLRRFIKPKVTKEALDLVQKYKEAGYITVMVTATHRFPVEPIAKLFHMDDLICSEPEEDEKGEFTGGWISHSFGPNKVTAVKNYMKARGQEEKNWEGCVFYSDSKNDYPLLQTMEDYGGQPYAANPDPYLEKIAKEKRWPIVRLFDSVVAPEPIISEK